MLLPADKGGTGPKRFRVATLQKCFSDHTELSANRGEIQRSKVWGKTRTSWVTGKTAIKYPCCSSLMSDCHGFHDVYELRDGRTHHCDLLPC